MKRIIKEQIEQKLIELITKFLNTHFKKEMRSIMPGGIMITDLDGRIVFEGTLYAELVKVFNLSFNEAKEMVNQWLNS